jgi:hypothetical protein
MAEQRYPGAPGQGRDPGRPRTPLGPVDPLTGPSPLEAAPAPAPGSAPNTGPIGPLSGSLDPRPASVPAPAAPLVPRMPDQQSQPSGGDLGRPTGPSAPGQPAPMTPPTGQPQATPLELGGGLGRPPMRPDQPLPQGLSLGPGSAQWGGDQPPGAAPPNWSGQRDPFPFPDPARPAGLRPPMVPRPVQASPPSGPITQPTLMLRPFDLLPAGSSPPPETGRESAVDSQPDDDDDGSAPGASLVRPYSRTGGRTKPGRDLALEALVSTTVSGRDAWHSPLLTPEHSSVIELCSGTVSVAEIAARLAVPLGVARVIIADMVDLGLVEVMKTSASAGDERDPAFLRRVLSGLQRL